MPKQTTALTALKKKLLDSKFTYFALCAEDGSSIIAFPKPGATVSKLDQVNKIFDHLPDYEGDEIYILANTVHRATKPTAKKFPIPGQTLDSQPVLSQAHSVDISTAERLGSLETENSFLKAKIADLEKELEQFKSLVDEDEDLEEEADEPFAEEPKQTWVDFLAPAIPSLIDKAGALLDIYINKKMMGTNGNFENLPNSLNQIEPPQAPQPPVLDIDYEKLAHLVAKKLEQTGSY